MDNARKFYIDGAWVDPVAPAYLDVIDPSTEEAFEQTAADVGRAVAAFPGLSQTSREERLALLERVVAAYRARYEQVAQTLSREMGAPITLARSAQAALTTWPGTARRHPAATSSPATVGIRGFRPGGVPRDESRDRLRRRLTRLPRALSRCANRVVVGRVTF